MNKIFLTIFLALISIGVMASATRTIDADVILSSDHSKTFTLPSSTGTLVISGAVPVAAQFTRDGFSGTGAQTAFTLSQTPASSAEVRVFQDGLLLIQTTDYTISGTTLTMVTAPALGQTLAVIYSRF